MARVVTFEEANKYREVAVKMPELKGKSKAFRPVLTYINVRKLEEEIDLGFFLFRGGQVETLTALQARLRGAIERLTSDLRGGATPIDFEGNRWVDGQGWVKES